MCIFSELVKFYIITKKIKIKLLNQTNYKLIKAVTKDVHALLAKGLTPFPGSFHATCSDCIFWIKGHLILTI